MPLLISASTFRRSRAAWMVQWLPNFSDHFTRQLMAGIMAQDYLGLCPKPGHRVEGGGRPAGCVFRMPGNRLPAATWMFAWLMGSRPCLMWRPEKETNLWHWPPTCHSTIPLEVFYSGYYAVMVTRHMKEFGTTVEHQAALPAKFQTQTNQCLLCPQKAAAIKTSESGGFGSFSCLDDRHFRAFVRGSQLKDASRQTSRFKRLLHGYANA